MDYLQYEFDALGYNDLQTSGVLNLIINGLPSIPWKENNSGKSLKSFKPYYKWITFNTQKDT